MNISQLFQFYLACGLSHTEAADAAFRDSLAVDPSSLLIRRHFEIDAQGAFRAAIWAETEREPDDADAPAEFAVITPVVVFYVNARGRARAGCLPIVPFFATNRPFRSFCRAALLTDEAISGL